MPERVMINSGTGYIGAALSAHTVHALKIA